MSKQQENNEPNLVQQALLIILQEVEPGTENDDLWSTAKFKTVIEDYTLRQVNSNELITELQNAGFKQKFTSGQIFWLVKQK